MEKYVTVGDLKSKLATLKEKGKTVGFVPTMGALHKGHLSLIEQSRKMCDITVASIFVNPTQFNDSADYQRYPRTPENDGQMLADAGCDMVFVPSETEIYPCIDNRTFDFGNLDKVMEGKFRPGHFNGVAQVVSRLFDIVNPDRAFFGQKDFQQVSIIKDMVRQLNLSTKIIVCPIIREQDGLAMSSRNMLLTKEQRAEAAGISKALFHARQQATKMSITDLRDEVISMINASPELEVEYLEIVAAEDLQPVAGWDGYGEIFVCTAVYAGKIRLIDNIQLK
jgi:pantoate--beta-alanine ligase